MDTHYKDKTAVKPPYTLLNIYMGVTAVIWTKIQNDLAT